MNSHISNFRSQSFVNKDYFSPVLRSLISSVALTALSIGVFLPQYLNAQDTTPAARSPDVIFVPTPMDVVNEMLSVTKVSKADTLFDLGSGDGRIVIAAVKRFGTTGIGIDIDPKRVQESRNNADTAGVKVDFRQADLFETDLRSATVVTLYLLPALNVKLRPKLFKELRPGTRIVSHAFDMGDWQADSTIDLNGRKVHYWLLPANVAGTWTVKSSPDEYELNLTQRFQKLSGTATLKGKEVPLKDLKIKGETVFFTIDGKKFEGTVRDGKITGNQWTASRVEKTSPVIAD